MSSENEEIAEWLVHLTEKESDWGFGLCFDYLRNVGGFTWNHKRVYRIYCQLALNLRIKPRRRLKRNKPEPLKEPTPINQVWSMDFINDQLSDGKKFRLINVIDDYRRKGISIEGGFHYRLFELFEYLISFYNGAQNRQQYGATTGLNSSAMYLLNELNNIIFTLNIFSQEIHNKTLILKEQIERSVTAGSVNIFLKQSKQFKTMQRTGYDFIITNGRIKQTAVSHL